MLRQVFLAAVLCLGAFAAEAFFPDCVSESPGACDEDVHEVSLLSVGQQVVRRTRSELLDAQPREASAKQPLEALGGAAAPVLAAASVSVSDVSAASPADQAVDLPAVSPTDSAVDAVHVPVVSQEEDDLVAAIQSSAVLIHRPPPAQGLDAEWYGKEVSPWRVIYSTSRVVHEGPVDDLSLRAFLSSAGPTEWVVFAVFLPLMILLHFHLVDWPSTRRYHGLALFIWFGVGLIFLSFVWLRLGYAAATQWMTGYLLELIFSIENVFVFHVVVSAFKSPRRATQKALFVIICCQITFQGIFYMGLATTLRQMSFLPYLLGVWLLYAGYQAAISDAHADINIKETGIFKFLENGFGDRLIPEYVTDENERHQVMVLKEDKWHISMAGPLTICMVLAVFLLEIDVTLTIIAQVENEYIAFTSCAVAGWCVPELFFVARDLFQRYFLLKYGVAFVLIFFGFEMLLHEVFHIPDVVCMGMILVVMALCMLLSSCFRPTPEPGTESETDGEGAKELPLGYAGWPAAQGMLRQQSPIHMLRQQSAPDPRGRRNPDPRVPFVAPG